MLHTPVSDSLMSRQYSLEGRDFPLIVMLTRSPAGFGSRSTGMLKSMALMIPSPDSSALGLLAREDGGGHFVAGHAGTVTAPSLTSASSVVQRPCFGRGPEVPG